MKIQIISTFEKSFKANFYQQFNANCNQKDQEEWVLPPLLNEAQKKYKIRKFLTHKNIIAKTDDNNGT